VFDGKYSILGCLTRALKNLPIVRIVIFKDFSHITLSSITKITDLIEIMLFIDSLMKNS